jgi:hypothetical protein
MITLFGPHILFLKNATPDIASAGLQFGDDKTYIGLYHAALVNAKTDIGFEIDHGAGLEIFVVIS